MAFSYESALKRTCFCFSFKTDSFWSWLLVGVAFLNTLLNTGVVSALGAFFGSWRQEFGGADDVGGDALLPGNATGVSDATLTWIQSCAFSLCYMSSPIANAVLRTFPPRMVMIGVSVILYLSFVAAAELGEGR